MYAPVQIVTEEKEHIGCPMLARASRFLDLNILHEVGETDKGKLVLCMVVESYIHHRGDNIAVLTSQKETRGSIEHTV